jgi:hypothetical protein
MFKKLLAKYPYLYTCKACGKKVKVKVVKNAEPIIKRTCGCPADTIVAANHKATMYAVGTVNGVQKVNRILKLKTINFLCWLTGRSV